jgi:hypothetical protein
MALDGLKESGHSDDGLLVGVFEETCGKWRTRLRSGILTKIGKLIGVGLDGGVGKNAAADR